MWKTEHAEISTASADDVWRVISDVEHWADWNPGYREAHLDGELRPGASGRVVLANGMQRPFSLVEATPNAALVIGASGPGVTQRFGHRVEALPDGGTRVSMAATMDGPLTPLLSRIFGRVMAGYYPTAVRQLVATAEGRPFERAQHA